MTKLIGWIKQLRLSGTDIRLLQDGSVYKAIDQSGHEWYIPSKSIKFARWAFKFMETHERYIEALRDGDVVVEVGACTGEYTIPAAKKVGIGGKIFAIEADPLGCECIKKNAELHGLNNIEIISAAVSDCSGKHVVLDIPNNLTGGLLKSDEKSGLQTITLDELLEDVRVDVLKLTVNGHEPEILRGTAVCLNNVRSVSFQSVYHQSIIDFLVARGFTVERLDDVMSKQIGVKTGLLTRI